MRKITNDELKKMLKEVEVELGGLMKAVPSQSPDDNNDESPNGGADASAPEGSASSANDAPPPAPPASEGSPENAEVGAEGGPPEGQQDASTPPPEAGGDPAQEAAASPEELESEYSQLPPEELKAHFLACRAAMQKVMGGEGTPQAGAEGSAPGAGAPPPPQGAGSPPPGAGAPLARGELKGTSGTDDRSQGGQITKKSEDEHVKILQAQVEQLTKAVEIMAGTPIRKAVTSVDFVNKTEQSKETKQFSAVEITKQLNEVTMSPTLKKSDRELVNAYYDGKVKVDKIAHLLSRE